MAHLNRKIGIPSFDMTGKTAIITGGTQGLGFGMACALAAYGANVVITARTARKVEDAVADLNENYCKGGRAFGIPADSSKPENVKMVVEKTVEEFGSLDILINNAGIARTFQNIRLFKDLSVLDNVKAGLHNHHTYSTLEGILRLPRYYKVEKEMDEKAMELLKVFGLDGECDFKASNLPYGKQRKLEIARALATKPKLLLLDEPAAGMNPNETAELMETIRFVRDHFGMTILLIEHDMKLVSGICERLTVLNFGQVLCTGPTQDVLSNPEVIKAYLGE